MGGTYTKNLDFYGMMDNYKYHNKLNNINSGLYGTGDHLGMVQRFELPRDPTANDDDKNNANAGKRVLLPAMWLNTVTQKIFICLDNTSATAVWIEIISKADIDALIDATMKNPEAYDPTVTGNYPTTYGGEAIEAGDTFRITALQAGIGDGTRDVMGQDLLISIVDDPSATDADDWMVAEGNLDQATESIMGIAKIATQVIADAGTNDTDFVTPLKLATYLDNAGIYELTFGNGITEGLGGNVSLGGTFTANTDLYRDGNAFEIKDSSTANEQLYIDDTDVKLLVGGDDTVAGFTGNWSSGDSETIVKMATASYSLTLTSGGASDTAVFADTNSKGIVYAGDYSANFTDRSIVDKAYVDSAITSNVWVKEVFTLTSTDVSNGYVILANVPLDFSIDVVVSGSLKSQGATADYTLTGGGDRLEPTGSWTWTDGDVIEVKYCYVSGGTTVPEG